MPSHRVFNHFVKYKKFSLNFLFLSDSAFSRSYSTLGSRYFSVGSSNDALISSPLSVCFVRITRKESIVCLTSHAAPQIPLTWTNRPWLCATLSSILANPARIRTLKVRIDSSPRNLLFCQSSAARHHFHQSPSRQYLTGTTTVIQSWVFE